MSTLRGSASLPLIGSCRSKGPRWAGLIAALLLGPALGAENVILFIGDGMGFEHVKAARCYNGGPLSFEELPYQAQVTTHSANNSVTDSAAAGTALATGVKVNNYVVSLAVPGDGAELETTLEFHQKLPKRVGLITTTYLTHATPATFGAHETDRNNTAQIAGDYLGQTRPHLLFGGGGNGLTPGTTATAGYEVVTDLSSFTAWEPTGGYLSAQFGETFMPYEFDYAWEDYPYPHLSEMVAKALGVFGSDPAGFFLMVEGGMIDQACHANDLRRSIHETLEFSRAVQVACGWAAGRSDTLILVTADHETGGLRVTQDNGAGYYPAVTWSTTGHTGANVPAYAWGRDAHRVTGLLDNTDIHRICTGKPIPVFTPLVAAGSTWKYDASGSDLGTAWRNLDYDDSSWASGPAKLGYGDGDEVTPLPKTSPVYSCYYFRHTFPVDHPNAYGDLALRILRDDGAVVYLNGLEVARYNLPDGAITYDTWASTAADYPWDAAVSIPNLLVPGANVLAVEVHQCSSTSSDLALDLELNAQQLSGAPSAPVLTAVAGDQTVTLAWTASRDPEGAPVTYSIYRRLATEDYDGPLAEGLVDTTYTDNAVNNQVTYYYLVRALDTQEDLYADSAEVSATPAVPDYTAYVIQNPTLAYGTVIGSYTALQPGAGGSQSLTESKVGLTGRLDAEYRLETIARPADIAWVTLRLAGTYTDQGDPLVILLWTGSSWSDITALVVEGAYSAPLSCVDADGVIRLRFTDSVSVRKEPLDTLTLEWLYADVTLGEPGSSPNRPPVAQNDTASTTVDTAVAVNVLANDYDPDNDPLSVSIAQGPSHGTAELNVEDQTVHYQPSSGYSGLDSFTYQVSDGRGGTATATVTLTVSPTGLPPTVEVSSITLSATQAGKNWKATASVAVINQDGDAAAGATLGGDWLFHSSPIQTGAIATTDASGTALFSSPTVKTSGGTFTFRVTGVQLTGHSYVGGVESASLQVP